MKKWVSAVDSNGMSLFRLCVGLICLAMPATAEFKPPRVTDVIRRDVVAEPFNHMGPPQYCIIDRGTEVKMEKGDLLNIYRQKRVITRPDHAMQVLLGSMIVTEVDVGSSMGVFTPDSSAFSNPLLRVANVMAGDVAIPSLVLDSDVLFDPGQAQLKPSAASEVQKVADFIIFHKPPTLIIEGHTDSDGDVDLNEELSLARANALRQRLLDSFAAIDGNVIQTRGRGESQPIAPNDSAANKALNRRIELVVVWEVLEERAKSGGPGDEEETAAAGAP